MIRFAPKSRNGLVANGFNTSGVTAHLSLTFGCRGFIKRHLRPSSAPAPLCSIQTSRSGSGTRHRKHNSGDDSERPCRPSRFLEATMCISRIGPSADSEVNKLLRPAEPASIARELKQHLPSDLNLVRNNTGDEDSNGRDERSRNRYSIPHFWRQIE